MLKIMVSGSAGFLGSHIVENLVSRGYSVVGIDNMSGGDARNIKTKQYYEDTSDFKAMDRIFEIEKPDIVYHTACAPYEGFSVFSPHKITQNTFGNTTGILSASIKHNVKRFIYCSSMSRYGLQNPPYNEEMIPFPNDPYAIAKVASEQLLKQMSETHGIEYVIAIPHNIIGVRQKYDDPYRNVASIFINRNLQGKPAIIYGDGEQERCFSFIDDCIYSLIKMIGCPSGEIYNIGPDDQDGEVITINKLAEIIAGLTNFKGKPIYYPDRPREVKYAYTSSEKIRKEFGYKTTVKLEDGLKQMVEDIKQNGVKPFDYYHLELEIENDHTPRTWTDKLI